jgi:hypothetical protein
MHTRWQNNPFREVTGQMFLSEDVPPCLYCVSFMHDNGLNREQRERRKSTSYRPSLDQTTMRVLDQNLLTQTMSLL